MVYNFNNQNLISYQDNFHSKCDIPFVIYFDFETTAPTANCLDPELQINQIVIQRSFAHSIEQLTNLNYSTQEEIKFLDNTLLKMLRDMAFDVSKRKCKNNMGQMFCIENALVKKTILQWFNKKNKQQFVEMSPIKKLDMKNKTV